MALSSISSVGCASIVLARRQLGSDVGEYFSSLLGVVMLKTISIIFRVILFYVLLWIRVPVALILQAVTSLSAMAFVVMLVVRGWSNAIDVFWPLLAFSFGAFVLRWIYDGILMLVSPEELFLDI